MIMARNGCHPAKLATIMKYPGGQPHQAFKAHRYALGAYHHDREEFMRRKT
jgi:hypothetical protein